MTLDRFVQALEERDARLLRRVVDTAITELDLEMLTRQSRYWRRRWQRRRAHLKRAAVQILIGAACCAFAITASAEKRPSPLAYALSARLCGQLEHRAEMKHRITSTLQEAKAHPGTVVDLRELVSDQRSVREVEVAIADTRAAMRRARVRPVACTNPNVVVVEGCLGALIVGREASTAWWVHDDPELCTPGVKGAIADARHVLGED